MKSAAASVFRHLGDRLALLEAQCLDRQPGPPQIGLAHRDRRLAQRLGDAVVVPEHLGGAGRGQLQDFSLRVGAPLQSSVHSR